MEIEQVGGVFESHIFQLQDRRVACIADIAVTNQTSRTIDLIDVELRTPWDNRRFEWLLPSQVKFQTCRKRDCSPLVYRFPGLGPEFAYKEVINHHLLEREKLPGQRRLVGWLLGIGGVMPDNLVHGDWLKMSLTIIGADHAEYSEPIIFWTERLLARPTIVKTRTPIFPKLVEEQAKLARDVTRIAELPASSPPGSKRT